MLKKGSLDRKQFPFLIKNREALLSRKFDELLSKVDTKKAKKYFKKVKRPFLKAEIDFVILMRIYLFIVLFFVFF